MTKRSTKKTPQQIERAEKLAWKKEQREYYKIMNPIFAFFSKKLFEEKLERVKKSKVQPALKEGKKIKVEIQEEKIQEIVDKVSPVAVFEQEISTQESEQEEFYEIEFSDEIENAIDIMMETKDEAVICGFKNKKQSRQQQQKTAYNQNRKKLSQTLSIKQEKLQEAGFNKVIRKDDFLIATKSIPLNSLSQYRIGGKDSQEKFGKKMHAVIREIKSIRTNVLIQKFQEIDKTSDIKYMLKIVKGKAVTQIPTDADDKLLWQLASELCSTQEYYQNDDSFEQGLEFDAPVLNFTISQGVIRGDENLIKNGFKNGIMINPNTKTRCISDSVAIVQTLKDVNLNMNYIFQNAKQLSEKIANEYKIQKGGSVEDLKKICEDFKIKIYQPKDTVTENGIMAIKSHCLVVLVENDYNHAVAEKLSSQYHDQKDKIMEFDKKKLVEKDSNKRQKLYCTYDFEFTHDDDQLAQKKIKNQKLKIDQQEYACTVTEFYNSENSQFYKQTEVLDGKDAATKLVKKISQICEKYPKHDIIFYGHNAQKADYPIFCNLLAKYFDKDYCDFATNMSTISYNWNKGEQRIQFQDSLSLFPATRLETLGKMFNCDSQKQDCDHSKINIKNWEEQWEIQKLKIYCAADTETLAESLYKYNVLIKERYGFEILGQNNILSNSSLAQKVLFANYYDPKECPIYTIPQEYFEFCKKAYHGGSVQLFFKGYKKGIRGMSIDINSSYAGQMLKYLFPCGPYYRIIFQNQLYKGQELQMGIYEIFIKNSPNTDLPVFFTINSETGVSQPCKIKNAKIVVTSVEIEHAFKNGYTEIYLIEAIVSKTASRPFKKFIEEHYALRLKHKKLRDTEEQKNGKSAEYYSQECQQGLCKNLMCSCYGKFSLNCYREVSKELTTSEEVIIEMLQNGTLTDYEEKEIHGKKFYEFSGVQQQQSNLVNMMLAAFITAYGRIQLNQIQRDLLAAGFILLYSDTDSVYFYAPEHWDNKTVNQKLAEVGQKHCHKTDLGMCKYETKEDVGDCLAIYNKNIQDEEQKLQHPFFDECAILCLKTYGIHNSMTNLSHLKAKGIPQWMLVQKDEDDQKRALQRCLFNGNERQFDFSDYKKCALENKPFEFEIVQFSVVKKNMLKGYGSIKEGQKISKTVRCTYDQKIILSTGKVMVKMIDFDASIDLEVKLKSLNGFAQEDWAQFNTLKELKQQLNVEEENWDKFVSQNNIIRTPEFKFILFKDFDAYCRFFEKVIKPIPVDKRNYHQLNSQQKQAIQFDIDCDGDELEHIKQCEIDPFSQEQLDKLINVLVEQFQLEGLEHEVINRSRENKVSYHIRFAGRNITLAQIQTLSKFNRSKTISDLYYCIDKAVYSNQLRITTNDVKYLYNPENFIIQPKLSQKALVHYKQTEQVNKTLQQTKSAKITDGQDAKFVQQWLEENKLDSTFQYQKTKKNEFKKGCVQFLLTHKKGVAYFCKSCDRIHQKDNCIFLESSYDYSAKKQQVKIKCFKSLPIECDIEKEQHAKQKVDQYKQDVEVKKIQIDEIQTQLQIQEERQKDSRVEKAKQKLEKTKARLEKLRQRIDKNEEIVKQKQDSIKEKKQKMTSKKPSLLQPIV